MAKAGYLTSTEGAVSLSLGVTKTVLAVTAPAQFGIDARGFRLAFNGIAEKEPVITELVRFDGTTAGTSTATTVDQAYGPSIVAGFTGAKNYTAEPTVGTPLDEWLLTPNSGSAWIDFPFAEGIDTAISQTLGLRLNAPEEDVDCRATLRFERT